jgi:hypothetical protein
MNLTCDKCGKIFTRLIDLTRHRARKNPCNRDLKCLRCEKKFTQIGHLNSHINRKYPCEDKNIELKLKLELKDKEIIIKKEELAIEKEKTKQASLNKGKTINIQNIFGDQITYINNVDELELVKPPSQWYAEKLIKTGDVSETLSRMIKYQINNDDYPKNKVFKKHEGEIYAKLNDKVVAFNKSRFALIELIQKSCKGIDDTFGPLTEDEMYLEGLSQRNDHIHEEGINTIKKVDKYVGNTRNNKHIEHAVKLNI